MVGKISDDKFYTTIDIEMVLLGQTIHVVFGTDDFGSSIHSALSEKQMQTTNVYTLQGILVKGNVEKAHALDGLQKGIYIVDGKKVIKNKVTGCDSPKKDDKCRWRKPHRHLSYKQLNTSHFPNLNDFLRKTAENEKSICLE